MGMKYLEKDSNNKYTITHLDKKFSTIHYSNITDSKCEEIKQEFYKLPDKELVIKQMNKLMDIGKKTNNIIDYYLKALIAKARLSTSKWSVEELFNSNDLIRFLHGKITNCSDFYDNKSEISNIKTVLRLSPSGTAAKVSNFPYKTMLDIFERYNTNDNYYDYSCGWGIRLLSSLANNINYFGTDPNNELVDKLKEMYSCFKQNTSTTSTSDIRCLGSETFIPGWENKMGLIFSSPPYYDLEDYRIGKQSINNRTYQEWLIEYWTETVLNSSRYITQNGYFLLNIKNIKKYALLDDMKKIIETNGFTYIESIGLKNINRIFLKQNGKNTDEVIMVFKKIL